MQIMCQKLHVYFTDILLKTFFSQVNTLQDKLKCIHIILPVRKA